MNFTLSLLRKLNGRPVLIVANGIGQETLESGCFVRRVGEIMLNLALWIQ